ncbi:MAG: FCD domain-containing protein [Spirochaetota bacterium]
MKHPLKRTALDVTVRDYVVQFILDNGLQAGDALPPETQLAEVLGVGRSSIREAVKYLQSLGIVEVRHGTGLFVRESNFDPLREIVGYVIRFSTRGLAELGEIRFLLERAAIEEVVSLIGPEDIRRLEDILESWKRADQKNEPCDNLDNEFHQVLYSPLKNNMLIMLLKEFWTAFEQLDDPALHEDKPAGEELADHRSILEAVKAGDPELSRQLLTKHFRHLQDCIGRVKNKIIQKDG